MALTEAQKGLKDQFERVHGYWNPTWEPILQAIPEQFAAYVNFSGVPYRSGALAPKTRELISIAVNIAMTLMNEPAARVHIRNALRLGATREEILEVFGICTVLGVHSVSHSLPFLVDEMERRGRPVDLALSDRAREVQAAWLKDRGYWPPSFNTILALDPEFVSAYSKFSNAPRIGGPLDMKTVELICVAIDGSATHLFENGVRTHGVAAIRHGATIEEVIETLELASITGMQSMIAGVPILDEEMAKLADR